MSKGASGMIWVVIVLIIAIAYLFLGTDLLYGSTEKAKSVLSDVTSCSSVAGIASIAVCKPSCSGNWDELPGGSALCEDQRCCYLDDPKKEYGGKLLLVADNKYIPFTDKPMTIPRDQSFSLLYVPRIKAQEDAAPIFDKTCQVEITGDSESITGPLIGDDITSCYASAGGKAEAVELYEGSYDTLSEEAKPDGAKYTLTLMITGDLPGPNPTTFTLEFAK